MADTLHVSRQFVQTVCNDLNGVGLLEFQDNPRHKRSKLVALTEEGTRVFELGKEKEAAIVENNLPDLDAEQVMRASALIADIRERIQGAGVDGLTLE